MNVEAVNDHYLADSNVLNEVLSLMHTAIFKPNFQNDTFIQSIVEREKEMVKQRIHSIFDDKTRYAQHRLLQILRPNHPASTSSNGTLEALDEVTIHTLRDAYTSMLTQDAIDIYVVGDVNVEELTEKIKEILPFADREKVQNQQQNSTPEKPAPYTKEQHDMKQAWQNAAFRQRPSSKKYRINAIHKIQYDRTGTCQGHLEHQRNYPQHI